MGRLHFLHPTAPQMAQQAAIADLLDLMDTLSLERVGRAGYDWGGCAALTTFAELPGTKSPRDMQGLLRDQPMIQADIGHAETHLRAGPAFLTNGRASR